MKSAVNNAVKLKVLGFNLVKRPVPKTGIEKLDIQESMRRVQALRGRISSLRLQCEELRTAMNDRHDATSLCVECGQQIENNEAVVYSTVSERRAICKSCFSEIWKRTGDARLA